MIVNAIEWIKQNRLPDGSIIVSSSKKVSYPEVTGYFIPTLMLVGEEGLARQFAFNLKSMQLADGSFGSPNGSSGFAFDTGQVIRGWVSVLQKYPALASSLRRACDWLLASADQSTGRLRIPEPGGDWSLGSRGEVNEGIHIYALAPLRQAGKLLGERRYTDFADKSINYYLKNADLINFERPNALTHFFAYIQEALCELGHEELARRGMASVARYQRENGAVPAYSNVSWVCSTGLAQLAKVWYLLGEGERADRALGHLATLQNPGGGFFGSYGALAEYFPHEEISWAVKYAIEAVQAQIVHHFNHTAQEYSNTISMNDGRVQAVLNAAGDLNGKKVLDAGCGKGRYSALLKQLFPVADITAMDISSEMLMRIPAGISKVKHGILNMPFVNESFDLVLCIEALEHVVQIDAGIKELARVVAPGGKLIVIDKNKEKLGVLEMPPWECWFGREELSDKMSKCGLDVQADFITYDTKTTPDGLFISWTGTKRSNFIFTESAYSPTLHSQKGANSIMDSLNNMSVNISMKPRSDVMPTEEKHVICHHDNIRLFNPQILLGDRLGISLYCFFAVEYLYGGSGIAERLYDKFINHFNENVEHSIGKFRNLIDSIRTNGFDPVQGVWANPHERTLVNGSHRCAAAIALGITNIPYYLRFGENRAPDEAFNKIFNADELDLLKRIQEELIQQTAPLTSLQCRVRKIVREYPESFCAPFSSKTRLDAIRLYQGFEELGLIGKRPVESRFATYGIKEWIQPQMNVLEVGCNTGFLSLMTSRYVAHVTAFDADPAYIKIGELVQNYLHIDNCDFSFSQFESFQPSKQYDAVFACAVHGWLKITFSEFVDVILRSLKPSGLFLFETHELDCHPEAAMQRTYLLQFFEIIRYGFIDDADPYLYQSEFREYLVLRRK